MEFYTGLKSFGFASGLTEPLNGAQALAAGAQLMPVGVYCAFAQQIASVLVYSELQVRGGGQRESAQNRHRIGTKKPQILATSLWA
jgi:hypothetical protein